MALPLARRGARRSAGPFAGSERGACRRGSDPVAPRPKLPQKKGTRKTKSEPGAYWICRMECRGPHRRQVAGDVSMAST